MKTVIPADARAKLTCRLAPGQTPDGVAAAISAHVERHAPPSVEVRLVRHPGSSPAFSVEPDEPVLRAAADALASVYGRDPLAVRLGGTLPFGALVEEVLGTPIVMLGWCMPDENLHAPDEFFRLENFDRGTRVYVELFRRLGRATPTP
jgi:acetylornithine deacetylase/succinyl-diaminopimelate desuccinylase-like protein